MLNSGNKQVRSFMDGDAMNTMEQKGMSFEADASAITPYVLPKSRSAVKKRNFMRPT